MLFRIDPFLRQLKFDSPKKRTQECYNEDVESEQGDREVNRDTLSEAILPMYDATMEILEILETWAFRKALKLDSWKFLGARS